MNGPVLPAASPARPDRRPDAPGGLLGVLLGVLLAPVRALVFFGLSLAGTVLLAVAVVPVVLGAWAAGQLIAGVSHRQYALSNDPGQDRKSVV